MKSLGTWIMTGMADKPRILHDGKDLIWSLIPLALIALVVAGIAGLASWGFGDDANKQNIPRFDVSAGLHADATSMGFPIREPKTPAGWQPNSGSTQDVDGKLTSNVGWITDGGAYVQLTQTDAPEESLVRKLGGDEVAGTGDREIGGHHWVTYQNEKHKKIWVTDLRDVRIAVVSTGYDASMEKLANAVLAVQPLAPGARPTPTG